MDTNNIKKDDTLKLKDQRKSNTNIESLINHIEQCKIHLEILLEKLGVNETQLLSNNLDWPAISASFSIISSDMIAINKSLKEKSCYSLKSCVFVPKVFSEDVDQNLQTLTQNRMSIFNHDLIPQILRTKLMPELEEKEISLIRQTREFEQINKNGEKNIAQFKKMVTDCSETLDTRRYKDADIGKQQFMNQPTYNTHDTHELANLFINTSNRRMMPGMRQQQSFSQMGNR